MTKNLLSDSEKKMFFEDLFNILPPPILVVDSEMNVRLANENAARLFACTRFPQKKLGSLLVCGGEAECGLGQACGSCVLYNLISNLIKDDSITKAENSSAYINSRHDNPINLKFSLTPWQWRGERLAVLDVSEIVRDGSAEQWNNLLYRDMLENVSDLIFIHDLSGKVIHVNKAVNKLLGFTQQELAGRHLAELIPDKYRSQVDDYLQALKIHGSAAGVMQTVSRDGQDKYLSYNSSLFKNGVMMGRGIARDITTDYLASKILEETRERLERLVSNLPGIVFRCLNDRYFTMFYLSEYVYEVLGYRAEEIIENRTIPFIEIIHEEDRDNFIRQVNLQIQKRQPFFLDFRLKHRSGHVIHVFGSGSGFFSNNNELRYLEGVIFDITDKKRAEEQLRLQHAELIQLHNRVHHLSITDSLTGLFNRYYFEQTLERLIDDPKAYPLTLIIADVDGLKLINDTLGHQRGDEVLKSVAEVLRAPFRAGDVVSRTGGDEYAIILPRTSGSSARQMRVRINEEIMLKNQALDDVRLSVSIGIATAEAPGISVAELVKRADDAMYDEKIAVTNEARQGIVKSLLATLEVRDHMTSEHAARLQRLAEHFGKTADLNEREIDDLLLLTLLHDIGKVGVPDYILFKGGPLSPEERCMMQKHSEIGYRIAAATPELTAIARYVLLHHERWDGKGYPKKLQGRRIPIICRMLAIIDAYDAMVSDRPYRKSITQAEAASELRRCAGTQFDPELVELFLTKVLQLPPAKQEEENRD